MFTLALNEEIVRDPVSHLHPIHTFNFHLKANTTSTTVRDIILPAWLPRLCNFNETLPNSDSDIQHSILYSIKRTSAQ